jgi:putative isomerase
MALRDEANALGERIRETFFHEESGFFYDVRLETKEHIRVEGPEGWIPLWAGVATEDQAREVARVMMDPRKFLGVVPLPTLAMDHPEFDPSNGYWRGPVWLDQAYFGIQGLLDYGMEDEARELSRRLVDHAEGLTGRGPVFENYHPETGEGLNAPHFSWSAAHLLMLTHQGFLDEERKGP